MIGYRIQRLYTPHKTDSGYWTKLQCKEISSAVIQYAILQYPIQKRDLFFMTYSISDRCIGCGACAKKCPEEAIEGEIKVRFDIDPYLCKECGTCFDTCRQAAIIDPDGRPSPERQKKKAVKARVDADICAGCRTCLLNCPREAIRFIKPKVFSAGYCRVNTQNCAGCGTCTRSCITGAIQLL